MKNIITLNKSDIEKVIFESINEILKSGNGQIFQGFVKLTDIPSYLYHSSGFDNRYFILNQGLRASDNYVDWWEKGDEDPYEIMPKAVYLSKQPGFYGSLFDNPNLFDTWAVDTSKLDCEKFFKDPDSEIYMPDCYFYEGDIPKDVISIYKLGSISDEENALALKFYRMQTGNDCDLIK